MIYTIELFRVATPDQVLLTTSCEAADLEAAKNEAMRVLGEVQPRFHPDGIRLKDEEGKTVFSYISSPKI